MDSLTNLPKVDVKDVVFNCARDNKLYRLKVYLDHKPKEEVVNYVSALTDGVTPLVVACKNGHLDVAAYLIKNCYADIEQVVNTTFNGTTIEGASPLWCATAAGHLNIVRMLIKYNANVNSTTKTNSTPLRAACFDGHYAIATCLVFNGADIELANSDGHTCLMIACFRGHSRIVRFLLQCGADLNRKSVKGNTVLHDCVESGNLDMLKMLLQNGAKPECDSSGTTPLLSAAIIGHSHIVEYFITRSNHSTKQEKIDALEMLGATFMDKKNDFLMALNCWKTAMFMRYEDFESPLEKPIARSPISSYIDATEVRTLDELEDLYDPDQMMMQSLLVRARILGPDHPETIYYIKNTGATFASNGSFNRCIKLWMYVLDVHQKNEKTLSPMTQSTLFAFAKLFFSIMSDRRLFAGGFPSVSFQDILQVFQRALKEIVAALHLSTLQKDNNYRLQFSRTLTVTMHLIGLMCKLRPKLNENEVIELKRAVCQLVALNPKTVSGMTPLHLACSRNTSYAGQYPLFEFPSVEVVDLLLEVGAHPNATDCTNETPLHTAAANMPWAQACFKTLLNSGAHLDQCNIEKKTALELAEMTPFSDVYPLRYINLQCLCAQTIRKEKIFYEGFVHNDLKKFLDSH